MQHTHRTHFFLWLCALALWLGLPTTATAQTQPPAAPSPMSLAELEGWVRGASPAVDLSQTELVLAQERERTAHASQGAQMFGGASLASAREAVTDTLSRDYQRAQVQLGVRWPLLGSREAQLRATGAAGLATGLAQVRLLQTQREAVFAVRRAYVRHLRSSQRQALAQAFVENLPLAQQQLHQRQNSGVLLEADRLDLLALFDAVAAARDSQGAQQAAARRELARLTDQRLPDIQAQAVAWPAACRNADVLLAQADEHATVALARMELDGTTRAAGQVRHEGMQAGVSLAQSLSRDLGGSPGRNTTIGIDFSVPLQWRALRDATLGRIQSEQHRAESLLRLRRSEFQAALEQALAQWQLRSHEIPGHLRRLEAAHEGLRIAQLRLEAFDGDGYSRLLMARHALYQAAVQVVDGAERRELAELDLQALGTADCGSASIAQDDAASRTLAPSVAALAGLSAMGAANPSAKPPAPGPAGLGWYLWNGQAMLDKPAQLNKLPAGSRRVLLSFTAAQLQALATRAGQLQVQRLLTRAHSLGMSVELLLGEPTWVLPARRQALLDLLAPLRALPWDGLNLDLERSQLPADQQPDWDSNAMDTLRAVRAAVPWPLALTTHYRELQATDFAQRAHAAGATELVAMVYVSNPVRAAEIAAALLQQNPAGLRLAVAQSMERALPPEESSHSAGRAAALQRWRGLAQALAHWPGFSGIVVQSWEEFKEARP